MTEKTFLLTKLTCPILLCSQNGSSHWKWLQRLPSSFCQDNLHKIKGWITIKVMTNVGYKRFVNISVKPIVTSDIEEDPDGCKWIQMDARMSLKLIDAFYGLWPFGGLRLCFQAMYGEQRLWFPFWSLLTFVKYLKRFSMLFLCKGEKAIDGCLWVPTVEV